MPVWEHCASCPLNHPPTCPSCGAACGTRETPNPSLSNPLDMKIRRLLKYSFVFSDFVLLTFRHREDMEMAIYKDIDYSRKKSKFLKKIKVCCGIFV